MAMSPTEKDQKPSQSDRERRLARALRTNLMRRKAGHQTPVAQTNAGKSGEQD